MKSEKDMAASVRKHFGRGKTVSCGEVRVGRCRFDVVAYDKKDRVFRVVECKLHSRPRNIGSTFGQISSYLTVLKDRAFEFLDRASDGLQMRHGRWYEATDGWKRIRVAYYVALTNKACGQPDFIAIRNRYPEIGVIRVKPDGRCRHALRLKNGRADSKAALPIVQEIAIKYASNR